MAGLVPRGESKNLAKALAHAAKKTDPRAWLERIVQRTARILNWNRHSLAALVAVVSKRGVLSGEDLDAILKEVSRVEDAPQQTAPVPQRIAPRAPAIGCPHAQPCGCERSAGRYASAQRAGLHRRVAPLYF